MITVVVALLYCIGTVIFAWINRNEITDTTQLTMIVGLYIYDRCSYHLDDDENDERQIFRLCPDFYEYDYLRTRGCGRIPITREECLMLKAKGGRG
mgnify:CR=1 FL=1